MKNYLYYFAILVCCVSCKSSAKKDAEKDSSLAKAATVTTGLTTISESEATAMVHPFRGKTGFYNKPTSTWFSKEEILSLASILDDSSKLKLDGVRVYLGLRKDNTHTFLAVFTRNNGTYTPDFCGKPGPSTRSHKDTISTPKYPVFIGIDDNNNDNGATLHNAHCCDAGQLYVAVGLKDVHDIPCKQAADWVQNGMKPTSTLSTDTVNTYSEWFDKKLIYALRDELNKNENGKVKDGLRIYLARKTDSLVGCKTAQRHVFLLVVTDANPNPSNNLGTHIDNYTAYTKSRPNIDKGVYDNGEQCLNNCNGATMQ